MAYTTQHPNQQESRRDLRFSAMVVGGLVRSVSRLYNLPRPASSSQSSQKSNHFGALGYETLWLALAQRCSNFLAASLAQSRLTGCDKPASSAG